MDQMTDAVEAGQAVYTPMTLRLYDLVVHGLSNRFLWRVPTARLQALFEAHVGARHVDIGVGTGLFLNRLRSDARRELTLVDLNAASLAAAARRVERLAPRVVQANALAPMDLPGPFDSASLCYLLHCLPGTISEKAVVFDHLRPHLAPGAVIFGATLLQGDAPRSRGAQKLMDVYNAKGVFSNSGDRLEDLGAALSARFAQVEVSPVGCGALFVARV